MNFVDVYKREGLYRIPLPSTLGEEGAGEVISTGNGVTEVKEGDRVAWASVGGAYAEYANVPSNKLVPLPAMLSTETVPPSFSAFSRTMASPSPRPDRADTTERVDS